MRIRLPILLLIVAPVFLIIGYCIYWFTAAEAVRTGIDDWIVAQRAQGVQVQSGAIDVGGFPVMLEANADNVVMTHPAGAVWRSSGLSAEAPPWRLTQIDFRIQGPQTLTVPGIQPITATAGSGAGDVRLANTGRLSAVNLSLPDLAVLLPAIGDLKIATLDLALAELPDGITRTDLAVVGDARQVDLPVSPLPALGSQFAHAGVDLLITAPVPNQLHTTNLSLWRDSGGTLQIDRFHLEWGPLIVDASGTVTLDAALQPQADLTANVRGFLQTVDALVIAGMVEGEKAGLVKAGLALLAGAPDSDGIATLTAPLSIRDRRVFLGPLQLAVLPPVVWP